MATYYPRPAAAAALELPADVRLLQGTTQAVLLLAGVVLGAMLLAWALQQPVFALRAIRIEGDVNRNSVASLRATAAPQLRGNFVTLDLQDARSAFEAAPWVRRAVVHRVWPMRLVVQLEEHRAAALWGDDTEADTLVNSHGEVFEASLADLDDEALPRLSGPEGSAAAMLAMARRLAPVLAELKAGDLRLLQLSPRGSWRVAMDKGATLELGRGTEEEVLQRTQRFVQTMPRVLAAYQRPLQSADLRHHGGFAVRLHGVTTTDTPPPKPPVRAR